MRRPNILFRMPTQWGHVQVGTRRTHLGRIATEAWSQCHKNLAQRDSATLSKRKSWQNSIVKERNGGVPRTAAHGNSEQR